MTNARKETAAPVEAEIEPFPLAGFILGTHLCMTPSANAQKACFDIKGHAGDHTFHPWQGCRVRVPFGEGTVPFGGFAW